jgi:alpha-mannosidase
MTPSAAAHDVYLMNSNHTDYNWNATAAEYDAAILAELDYFLQQIAETASAPPEEQARYAPDCWWWLYLYEQNRTPEKFAQLIGAIRTGHITVPLNPFVTLYGALSTETAIRAGYYPGRIARRHGLRFPLAEYRENHTSPWGLASLWAGSGVAYTWKGVCGCWQSAPDRFDEELFIWQGPDGKTLLFKWYNLLGSNRDWGGYAEARDNLSDPSLIDLQIMRTQSRMPGISATGLFGAGWDDVSWQSTSVLDAVVAYNQNATGNTAVMSNGVDFFQNLEASGATSLLETLRGGWGNDWDMWPASLAERTSRARRALERMRTAEALAVWAELHSTGFWPPVRASLERGMVSAWKYFEHGWHVTDGGPSLAQMEADKESWAQHIEDAVDGAITAAEATISRLFTTPDEDRFAVFNTLSFNRTDVAEIEVTGPGPFIVTDIRTGFEAPSQLVTDGETTRLRFLARDVPSLGYRVYRYAVGIPSALPDAATVTPSSRTIENDGYRVVLGNRGEMINAVAKATDPDVELAGGNGLNDYGAGTVQSVVAEDVGPVSATLRVDLTGPRRTVRVTLYSDVDRIDIENAIRENETGFQTYRFHANLPGAEIRFEELGAIARPGLVTEGGDFLPGTRASRMTLNHFVSFGLDDFHLVLSNWDAYAMQVNDSTDSAFDLAGDDVKVVVMEQAQGAGSGNQGGDDFFLNRFALRGAEGRFDGAEAMRTAMAHQNPLHPVALPRNRTGPLRDATASLLSIDVNDVVVTAFKPAEDSRAGYIVRMWELGGQGRTVLIDASAISPSRAWQTSLVETDISVASMTNGVISASIGANEIATYRLSVPPARRPVPRRGHRLAR